MHDFGCMISLFNRVFMNGGARFTASTQLTVTNVNIKVDYRFDKSLFSVVTKHLPIFIA